MDLSERFNGFQLHHDFLRNHHVEPLFTQWFAKVSHGNHPLSLDSKARSAQLDRERLLVQTLKKPGAKSLLDPYCGADDLLCQRIIIWR